MHVGGWKPKLTNGSFLSYREVTSEMLQGSALGPVLLTIFINELNEGVKTVLSSMADDVYLGEGGANTLKGKIKSHHWRAGPKTV